MRTQSFFVVILNNRHMILHYDTYTYGDGIITFYKDGMIIKDMLYSSQSELNKIIDEKTKKEW